MAAKLPIEKLPPVEQPALSVVPCNRHPAEDWRPERIGAWLSKPIIERKYLLMYEDQQSGEVQGFLPTDSKILVSGQAKVAKKSLFTFAVGAITASGKPYNSLAPMDARQAPVLALQAEGARTGTRDRWNWILNAMELDPSSIPLFFDHRTAIDVEDNKWFAAIRRQVEEHRIELLIFDPLVMYMTGDENSVSDVRDVMVRLGEVAKTDWGTSILFVHHLNKGSNRDGATQDIDAEIRGSSVIQGFYDTHYALRKRTVDQKHLELTRRGKDDEEAINSNGGKAEFELVKVEDFDKSLGDAIVTILGKLPDGKSSFRKKDLEAAWGANCNMNIVILIKAGKLAQAGAEYVRKD